MAGGIAGKLLGVYIDGVRIRCQLDATLSFTTNVEEEEPCKPDDGEDAATEDTWVERTITNRDWEITVNHRAFLDAIAINQADIIDKYVNGDLNVVAEFKSSVSNASLYPQNHVFSGPGIITSAALNAPNTGKANMDLTISGNGKPTFERIPTGSGA